MTLRVAAAFHVGDVGGPPKSLVGPLAATAGAERLRLALPWRGTAAELFPNAAIDVLGHAALTMPRSARQAVQLSWQAYRDTQVFRAWLKADRPDVAVVATTSIPAAVLAARRERVPVLVYAAEIYGGRGTATGAGGSALVRFIARQAAAVVCASDAVAAQFTTTTRARVVVIPPTVELRRPSACREALRRRFGVVDDGTLCIAVVGAITRGRGQDVLIRALPSIRARLGSVRCLIVGAPHPRRADLAYERRLRELAGAAAPGSVEFTGFVREIEDVYAAADVVVNPARMPEAYSRALVEALTAGRLVVASRTPGMAKVVDGGRAGLLVEPDDPRALADAIVSLWTDERLRRRLTEGAAEWIAQLPSAESASAAFAAVARDLVR